MRSQISGWDEVCAFGQNGSGDVQDNWKVECKKPDGLFVYGSDVFHIKHVSRGSYLSARREYHFNQRNCGHRCPIMGQLEISAKKDKDFDGSWKVHSGVIFLNENPEGKRSENEENEDYTEDL